MNRRTESQQAPMNMLKRIHEAGHPLMPLRKNAKLPLEKAWQKRPRKSWQDIQDYIDAGYGIGIRCDNLTVVDWDTKDGAQDWFNTNRPTTKMIVATKRGVHFYFKRNNESNTIGTFDIRSGTGGYVVAPTTTINGYTYTCPDGYDKIEHLEPCNPAWLPEKPRLPRRGVAIEGDMVLRAFTYVEKIPGANQGSRDNTCFYVACKLMQTFNLTTDQAWPILLAFNQRCTPPLTNMRQLRRKLDEAQKGT